MPCPACAADLVRVETRTIANDGNGDATDPPTPLGRELRALRTARGMSQTRLARRAGCEHSHVSRLESGARDPTRQMVEALAEALGCDGGERRRLIRAAGFLPDGDALDPDPLAAEFDAALARARGTADGDALRSAVRLLLRGIEER